MKRKVKIHAYVCQNGQVNAGLYENKDMEDHTDVGILADGLPSTLPIRQISIEVEVDIGELFKDYTIAGTVSPAGAIEPPVA